VATATNAKRADVGYCGIKDYRLRLCVNFVDRIVCEENAGVIESPAESLCLGVVNLDVKIFVYRCICF